MSKNFKHTDVSVHVSVSLSLSQCVCVMHIIVHRSGFQVNEKIHGVEVEHDGIAPYNIGGNTIIIEYGQTFLVLHLLGHAFAVFFDFICRRSVVLKPAFKWDTLYMCVVSCVFRNSMPNTL